MSMEAARKEIKKAAGTQFDPRVVEAFLSIPVERWRSIQKNLKVGKDSLNIP